MSRVGMRLAALGLTMILLAVGATYYAYEAYPFGWPVSRAVAGDEMGDAYEVVLHGVRKSIYGVSVDLTVRWVGDEPFRYFGFWGQWVLLESGETRETSLAVGWSRWQDRLRRAAMTVTFDLPETEAKPVALLCRFLLEGRRLECEIPITVPD